MKYAVVAVVMLALFSDYLLLTVIVPLVPDLFPDASAVEVGLLFSSKALVQILASPFAGHLADRAIGPRGCLALGLLVLTASTATWAFTESYGASLAARAVQGLASSLAMAGGMSLVARAHDGAERGRASGAAMSGVAAGVLAGPTVGGLLYGGFGRTTTFLALAGLIGMTLIAQLLLWWKGDSNAREVENEDLVAPLQDDDDQRLEVQSITSLEKSDSRPEEASASAIFFQLIMDPYIQILVASLTVANSIIAMLEPLVPALLTEHFDADARTIGLMWGVTPLSYLLFTPAAGYLSDRVSRSRIVAAALLVYGATLPFGAQFGPYLPLLLATAGVAGAATAFVDTPAMALLADIVEWRGIDAFGTVFAIADAATSLGFVIGPLLGESLAGWIEPKWTFVVFGAAALACAPLMLLLGNVPVSSGETLETGSTAAHYVPVSSGETLETGSTAAH